MVSQIYLAMKEVVLTTSKQHPTLFVGAGAAGAAGAGLSTPKKMNDFETLNKWVRTLCMMITIYLKRS